jgi:hypothetical protein
MGEQVSAANQATIDEVHAEARDDLDKLLPVARRHIEEYGPINGAVHLTTGILVQPEWDRVLIASVLGVALVRLAEIGPPVAASSETDKAGPND